MGMSAGSTGASSRGMGMTSALAPELSEVPATNPAPAAAAVFRKVRRLAPFTRLGDGSPPALRSEFVFARMFLIVVLCFFFAR
jgi:hypothetical protein